MSKNISALFDILQWGESLRIELMGKSHTWRIESHLRTLFEYE